MRVVLFQGEGDTFTAGSEIAGFPRCIEWPRWTREARFIGNLSVT